MHVDAHSGTAPNCQRAGIRQMTRARSLCAEAWTRLTAPMRRFASSQHGQVSAETVLVLPLVIWAFAATFVYFDVFRHVTTGQKAATLVGDVLSRMRDIPVDADQLERMNGLFAYLAEAKHPTNIRVSSIGWNADDAEYFLIWSYSTNWITQSGLLPSAPEATTNEDGTLNYHDAPLTNHVVNSVMQSTLPQLSQGETVILVESQIIFEPVFQVGISGRTLRQQVATRPRFAPQLAFDNGTAVVRQLFTPPTCDDGEALCGS